MGNKARGPRLAPSGLWGHGRPDGCAYNFEVRFPYKANLDVYQGAGELKLIHTDDGECRRAFRLRQGATICPTKLR